MAYRTVTQENCPHDSTVKMAGFTNRLECTRCQKIIISDTWLSSLSTMMVYHNVIKMSFRECIHCGREYASLFDGPTCSSKCMMEIS